MSAEYERARANRANRISSKLKRLKKTDAYTNAASDHERAAMEQTVRDAEEVVHQADRVAIARQFAESASTAASPAAVAAVAVGVAVTVTVVAGAPPAVAAPAAVAAPVAAPAASDGNVDRDENQDVASFVGHEPTDDEEDADDDDEKRDEDEDNEDEDEDEDNEEETGSDSESEEIITGDELRRRIISRQERFLAMLEAVALASEAERAAKREQRKKGVAE